MGMSIPVTALDKDNLAAKYIKLVNCNGYCGEIVMRKVAILCAFDSVPVKGRAGSDVFPEFAQDGVRT